MTRTEYLNLRVGDIIVLPDTHYFNWKNDDLYEGCPLAVITGFNRKEGIIHFCRECTYGGRGHSGFRWYHEGLIEPKLNNYD